MQVGFFKRLRVWLCRWRRVRGFGVQSPSSYRFVRYVINEHDPYYDYLDLREELHQLDTFSRKLGELFFRLSNYCQAPSMMLCGTVPDYADAYIGRGCHHTEVVRCRRLEDVKLSFDSFGESFSDARKPRESSKKASQPGWAIVSLESCGVDWVEYLVSKARPETVLVLLGIYQSRASKRLWKRLQSDARVVITYDLYYCGILMFDTTKSKENFKINF
jgi:hypothetical protein